MNHSMANSKNGCRVAEYNNQWSSEKTYQARIDFLMSGSQEQAGALYIDVTEDRLIIAVWDGTEAQKPEEQMQTWLEKTVYPEIPDEESRREFQACFNRENLIQTFQAGQPQLETKHRYKRDGLICCYRVNVNMFQNPDNGHIEACAAWEDYTTKYIDGQIQQILYQADYKALGLIQMEERRIYFRSNQFKGIHIPDKKVFSYCECVEQELAGRICEKDRAQFLKCTRIDYLSRNMAIAGQFSFMVHDLAYEVERYSYYWFDEDKRILLFVIDDMTKEAETDSLTGALNRTGFHRRAEEILANNPDRSFAIMYFNIQRFKAVNDLFGYEKGDQLICNIVHKLQTSFLKPLVTARMEADHFTVLVEEANIDYRKLTELLHDVMEVNNIRFDVIGRCGIYRIPRDCSLHVSEMCDRAKLAKTYISNQYVQPYIIFDDSMKMEYEEKSIALIQLEDAMAKGEFKVFYQPIYDSWTRKIVSAETLVRWISKENGMILPGRFIPVLEESGYITKVDSFMNRRVHDFLERRYKDGRTVVPLTVNLSRMDLMDTTIMDEIRRDIRRSSLPKEVFRYEITESACADITESGNEFLSELRGMGVKLLVDDFGSGLSSFSMMSDFEFDVMKLDMGFVHKLGTSKKNNSILISMIELAHRMDMKVVAEGVETEEQLDFLRRYGCDFIQGYYFSKPLPEEEFVKLLDDTDNVWK